METVTHLVEEGKPLAGAVGRPLLAEKGLTRLRRGRYKAGGMGRMLPSLAPDSTEVIDEGRQERAEKRAASNS
jgi:hypothetical protein